MRKGRRLRLEQIAVVLLQGVQRGLDVGFLILAGAESIRVQQGGNGLCIAPLGGGNGFFDASIKGHAVKLGLPLLVLVGKLAGQLGDPALQLGHVHVLERGEAVLGGFELLLQGFIVRERLLGRLDVPAVLGEDRVDDLLRQGLISYFEVLQKFGLHGISFCG